jgi:NAD dependent epimerase/dehydratase family enzyme
LPSCFPSDWRLTNKTFSKLLGKVLKRLAFFPAPKFAVTAMRGGEVADFVTASLRVVPRRALDKGYTRSGSTSSSPYSGTSWGR